MLSKLQHLLVFLLTPVLHIHNVLQLLQNFIKMKSHQHCYRFVGVAYMFKKIFFTEICQDLRRKTWLVIFRQEPPTFQILNQGITFHGTLCCFVSTGMKITLCNCGTDVIQLEPYSSHDNSTSLLSQVGLQPVGTIHHHCHLKAWTHRWSLKSLTTEASFTLSTWTLLMLHLYFILKPLHSECNKFPELPQNGVHFLKPSFKDV